MARWLIVLLLAGCSQQEPVNTKPDVPVAKGDAVSREYKLESGSMLVIDIPIPGVTRASERQTCYVWKSESGSTSLSCPNDSRTVTLDPPEK